MELYDVDIARKVAEYLLKIKAIKLQPNDPFTWASGWKSPIYCDNRLALSFPEVRDFVKTRLARVVTDKYGKPDVIAGVATGAIAQGVLVAQELNLPFIYVRSKAKGHGLSNQIEGYYEAGQNVVVIEDLISTGMSSLAAVDALREAGCNVTGMAAIFTYGFDHAKQRFIEAECPSTILSDYDNLLPTAVNSGYISEEQVELLQNWRKDPAGWTAPVKEA